MASDSPRVPVSVAVILLTRDQKDNTLRCLESLTRVTGGYHRTVLWDNGSVDGTGDAVREARPEVLVRDHPDNLGVAGGRNAAVDLAHASFAPTHVLFLDNDMTVRPDFLEHLLQPFHEDPRVAQTTGKILDLGDPRRIYGAGGCGVSFWRGKTAHVGNGEIDTGQYDRPRDCIPSGGCMLVRADVFRETGGFDTVFNPYGPEDLDFGFRVRRDGWRAVYVPDAVVFHETEPSRTASGGSYSETYAASKTRMWFVLMGRHATVAQRLGFLLLGAPWALITAVFREARRGNLGAVRGLLSGAFQALRGKR